MDILLSLFRGLLASAIGYAIWYLVCLIRQGQGKRHKKANPLLANRLLELLNGDTPTARRLLRNINRSHPGRSVNWCLEKAIHDLERDRR